ncbi:MAG: phosphate ABC transporter permease PstA [Novosphingobium sp.]|nr:phosphate ABC transporter permease PstA [Novosphingobium sp.]
MERIIWRRQALNLVVMVLASAATLFGLVWLVWLLWTTVTEGMAALSPKLLTQMTPPPGAEGGLANAFVGSLLIVTLGTLIGTPIGILAGTYLAEFGKRSKVAETIRFVNDILLSAPSIVIGLFVYELAVRTVGHFSGYAGGLALALILLPVVVRTTDESLRLVPATLREAALSLGLPMWKVVLNIVYRAGATGIATGVLLAVARISGETAPLLFTALNNQFWSTDMGTPMANVPVVIFQYAMSPYDSWHALAWAGALIVTAFVLGLSIVVRVLLRPRTYR